MKEEILEYLNGERDFDLGLVMLNKFGNRKGLSKLLDSCVSKGESEYNRNKMDFELIKLIGVTYHIVVSQKMRNYEIGVSGKPENSESGMISLTITGSDSLPDGCLIVEPLSPSATIYKMPENSDDGMITLTITGADSLPDEGLMVGNLPKKK